MVAAILIGTTTGFGFLVAFLFSISDYQALLSAVSPLLTGYNQATNNRVGATCLLVISIGCQLFAATGAVSAGCLAQFVSVCFLTGSLFGRLLQLAACPGHSPGMEVCARFPHQEVAQSSVSGLPASRLFSGVVPGLDVPLMGLILGSVIPIAYGASMCRFVRRQ